MNRVLQPSQATPDRCPADVAIARETGMRRPWRFHPGRKTGSAKWIRTTIKRINSALPCPVGHRGMDLVDPLRLERRPDGSRVRRAAITPRVSPTWRLRDESNVPARIRNPGAGVPRRRPMRCPVHGIEPGHLALTRRAPSHLAHRACSIHQSTEADRLVNGAAAWATAAVNSPPRGRRANVARARRPQKRFVQLLDC